MMTILSRRGFLLGAASLLAAPAIVRAENIMPIFVPKPAAPSIRYTEWDGVTYYDGVPLPKSIAWQWRDGIIRPEPEIRCLPNGLITYMSDADVERHGLLPRRLRA